MDPTHSIEVEPDLPSPTTDSTWPLYMMLPLDTVTETGFNYHHVPWFHQMLHTLRANGGHGVAVDVWWGVVERTPHQYDFTGYRQLVECVRSYGLHLQCVLSFHACGSNVGDEVSIPLPRWVRALGVHDQDLFFADCGAEIRRAGHDEADEEGDAEDGRSSLDETPSDEGASERASFSMPGGKLEEMEKGYILTAPRPTDSGASSLSGSTGVRVHRHLRRHVSHGVTHHRHHGSHHGTHHHAAHHNHHGSSSSSHHHHHRNPHDRRSSPTPLPPSSPYTPEYISLWADSDPTALGTRSPLEAYASFTRAFRSEFGLELGSVIDEIVVGLGPSGELRYPSHRAERGWKFPGVGDFQCHDARARRSLQEAAAKQGRPSSWASVPSILPHPPTTNSSSSSMLSSNVMMRSSPYNAMPNESPFFRDFEGEWETPRGDFFLSWYAQSLLDHAERVLGACIPALREDASIQVPLVESRGGSVRGGNLFPFSSSSSLSLRKSMEAMNQPPSIQEHEAPLDVETSAPVSPAALKSPVATPHRSLPGSNTASLTPLDPTTNEQIRLLLANTWTATASSSSNGRSTLSRRGSYTTVVDAAGYSRRIEQPLVRAQSRISMDSLLERGGWNGLAGAGVSGAATQQQAQALLPLSLSSTSLHRAAVVQPPLPAIVTAPSSVSFGAILQHPSPTSPRYQGPLVPTPSLPLPHSSTSLSSLASAASLQMPSSRIPTSSTPPLPPLTPLPASSLRISIKIAGIHWHHHTRSRAAEATTGYWSHETRDGYLPFAELAARFGIGLTFTCFEMSASQHPRAAASYPEGLLWQVRCAAARYGVPLAGENALALFSRTGVNRDALQRIVERTGGSAIVTPLQSLVPTPLTSPDKRIAGVQQQQQQQQQPASALQTAGRSLDLGTITSLPSLPMPLPVTAPLAPSSTTTSLHLEALATREEDATSVECSGSEGSRREEPSPTSVLPLPNGVPTSDDATSSKNKKESESMQQQVTAANVAKSEAYYSTRDQNGVARTAALLGQMTLTSEESLAPLPPACIRSLPPLVSFTFLRASSDLLEQETNRTSFVNFIRGIRRRMDF